MGRVEEEVRQMGEQQLFSGNHILALHAPEILWFLERGSVNLFVIKKRGGKPKGGRTLLATLQAPHFLFPFPVHPFYEVAAITEGNSTLWRVPLAEIKSTLQNEPHYVDLWINALALFHRKRVATQIDHYLESPKSLQVEAESTLALKRAVNLEEKQKVEWIEVESGELLFLGKAPLPTQTPLPMTYRAWIKSASRSALKVSSRVEDWERGVASYHALLLDYLVVAKRTAAEAERRRARLHLIQEEEQMDEALLKLGSVLNPLVLPEVKTLHAEEPLFRAFRHLGRTLKVTFHFPTSLPMQGDISLIISKIAEASDIRYRRVNLLGKWWKKDSGPLLAFRADDAEPVALLPTSSGYEMIIGVENRVQRVDATRARSLSSMAYTFYPCFPPDLKSGKEVVRFYFRHYRREFVPLFIYSILTALITLFPPFATEILINKAIPDSNDTLLWQIATALVMAAFSSSLFFLFRSLVVTRLEGKSSNLIQTALWDRLLKLPVSFFRRYSTGNLIMRVLATEWMRFLLSGNVTRVLFSGIFSLFYLIALFIYAPALTLIASSLLLLGFLITLGFALIYARMQKKFYELEGEINAFLIQIISAVAKLRTTGTERSAFVRWAQLFAKYKKVDLNAQHIKNMVITLNYLLPFLLYLAIFAYVLFTEKKYSVGQYLAFNTAFVSFYLAITGLNNTILEMVPVVPLWNRAKVIVEEPLEEQLKAESPGPLTGEIHVDGAFFHYEGEEHPILQDIHFKANPKEHIGIVGPSGSGKSTLLRLLLGFDKPTKGSIYYDDKDLSHFNLHDFRKQLGVVLQEEGIIAGSIYDNLTCGNIYALEQIERALEISGFDNDIKIFPMKLHTYLTTGGTTLSGGQRQRLLIARAVLPQPKILLLDEATSALDNKNQQKVIDSINHLDITRIVIAHRLSSVRNADRIYVMDRGKIVQVGTFDELASMPGLFATMLQRQSL